MNKSNRFMGQPSLAELMRMPETSTAFYLIPELTMVEAQRDVKKQACGIGAKDNVKQLYAIDTKLLDTQLMLQITVIIPGSPPKKRGRKTKQHQKR